jgi:hypothetical protein
MRIQANTTSLMEPFLGVFWYAVYALALFFILIARLWSGVKDSIGITAKNNQFNPQHNSHNKPIRKDPLCANQGTQLAQ